MLNDIISKTVQNLRHPDWIVEGKDVISSEKRIKHLNGVFQDAAALKSMDPEKVVYNVWAHLPENEGTIGGLFFGTTMIYPGKVGNEYFMTRGHFHENIDTAEYYWGINGDGVLILMDEERNIWAEKMEKGSLHYIQRGVAHRVANVGTEPLIFNACWPSDAGHNYGEIDQNGFSARLIDVNGKPFLKLI